MRRARVVVCALGVLSTGLSACSSLPPSATRAVWHAVHNPGRMYAARPSAAASARGIRKIRHVVVITQENRSFDSYFGTYPGAVGLRSRPRPCVPNPLGPCIRPFHTRSDVSAGGPHGYLAAIGDVANGSMNGFVQQSTFAQRQCLHVNSPVCGFSAPEQVMGHYGRREIPNYWAYARHFVLQDHFFEATNSWSLPQHLYMVSGWSALCADHAPGSCRSDLDLYGELMPHRKNKLIFAWTDITYLLHAFGVSWRYYVEPGSEPDCRSNNRIVCAPVAQDARTPGIWNPLPQFDTVREDRQLRNVQSTSRFFRAARAGRLPAVSWVVPNGVDSEHPPARVSDGMAWTTRVINAVMRSPDWKSTAIFLNWDDWGGYYDGVRPVGIDGQGYGLRVPAMVISPYARRGFVDHQTLSTDAYLKFIEDRWLGGRHLNPRTDGRPDPRPDVRERARALGSLLADFNFRQRPRPPFILRPRPVTDLVEPRGFPPPGRQCTRICLDRARTRSINGGGPARAPRRR